MERFKQWHSGLSVARKAGLYVVSFILLASVAAAASPPPNVPAKTPSTVQNTVITKEVTESHSVPFSSSIVEDATIAQGTSGTKVVGKDGTKTLTYKVTYSGGKEVSRKLISTVVTTEPVAEVIAKGTYVAPAYTNNTYTNVDGNTVQSPTYSATVPAGATARCGDSTYSFSQHRQGTCSHHGGVAQWL